MRSLMMLVLMLVAVSAAQAQEAAFDAPATPAPANREAPAPTIVTAPATQETTMELRTVEARERASTDADAAALPTQRGSFWWYVAILVVAGVILAVVL
jgi:hypothetical protein